MLDIMYKTMSISSGLYPNLDLWNANKLQLQLQLQEKIQNKLYRYRIIHSFYSITEFLECKIDKDNI